MHELVCELKAIVEELGYIPSRAEFEMKVKSAHNRLYTVGGYSAVLKAAGFETYNERRSSKKIDNSIFIRRYDELKSEYKSKNRTLVSKLPNTIIACDLHAPWQHDETVEKLLKRVDEKKPDIFVLAGDAADNFSHSRFPKSHNIITPREEREKTRGILESIFKRVSQAKKGIRIVLLMGNHDIVRPIKQILEYCPSVEDLVFETLKKDFEFKNVETIYDQREEFWLNENTIIIHGYRSQAGSHRDHTGLNVIHGHDHKLYVQYKPIAGSNLFEMSCGMLGDPNSKGLSYTPQKITHYQLGWGETDSLGPRVVAI